MWSVQIWEEPNGVQVLDNWVRTVPTQLVGWYQSAVANKEPATVSGTSELIDEVKPEHTGHHSQSDRVDHRVPVPRLSGALVPEDTFRTALQVKREPHRIRQVVLMF